MEWDVERTYFARVPGELVIPEAALYFAYATKFTDDFVNGRVAQDRVDAFVRSAPRTLRIEPVPREGRPPDFTGAVGRFTIDADVSTHTMTVGESVKLVLRIEGDGDLASFAAPAPRELEEFHVNGVIDSITPASSIDHGLRVLTYDVSPKDARTKAVPPLSFAYFDPIPPAGYRMLRTQPIRIDVRPAIASLRTAAPSVSERSGTGSTAPGGAQPPSAPSLPLVIAVGAALAVAVALLLRMTRRRTAR